MVVSHLWKSCLHAMAVIKHSDEITLVQVQCQLQFHVRYIYILCVHLRLTHNKWEKCIEWSNNNVLFSVSQDNRLHMEPVQSSIACSAATCWWWRGMWLRSHAGSHGRGDRTTLLSDETAPHLNCRGVAFCNSEHAQNIQKLTFNGIMVRIEF